MKVEYVEGLGVHGIGGGGKERNRTKDYGKFIWKLTLL